MNVLISGGGTGGHIFPALSIANALRRRDPSTNIQFVGANGRMEMERVPAAGYPIIGLTISGFDRKRLWRNFKVLWQLLKSRRKAARVIKEFRPDVVVGVGGYASGPTLMMAQKRHIPTLLQEQNSYAGVTNKHLAAKADAICVAYEGMERFFPADKIILTGNPVREAITACDTPRDEAKRLLGFDPERPLVAFIGGSLGARTINDSVAASLDAITANGTQVLWQTGKYYADECLPLAEGKPGVQAMAFVSRMDLVYRAADLVVSRAGAGTISELQLMGIASLLVPSPNVAEDHQRKNAQALVDHDAAVMLLDADCRGRLADTVNGLLADPSRLTTLRTNIRKMALEKSDDRIVDRIYELVENQKH